MNIIYNVKRIQCAPAIESKAIHAKNKRSMDLYKTESHIPLCSLLLGPVSHKAEPLVAYSVSRGPLELIMATLGGSRGDRQANSNHQKSFLVSPEKVREILNDGVSSADMEVDRLLLFFKLPLNSA